MKPIAYTVSYIFPVLAVLTMFIGGWSLVAVPLVTFGLVPLIELFVSGSQDNFSKEEERARVDSPILIGCCIFLFPFKWVLLAV